jgi:hypothetical protein
MSAAAPRPRVAPRSFLEGLRHFLTPPVWKDALAALANYEAIRWAAQPRLLVLLVVTWCAGDSLGERFETARAFYVASYQRQRRPGESPEGFCQARIEMSASSGLTGRPGSPKVLGVTPTPPLREVCSTFPKRESVRRASNLDSPDACSSRRPFACLSFPSGTQCVPKTQILRDFSHLGSVISGLT